VEYVTTNHQREQKRQLMHGKTVTGRRMVMVSKSKQRPGGKSVDNRTTVGADKFGQRTTQQAMGATDDTITNHGQERWRHSDVGGGCNDSDSGGKGEGMVVAESAAAAAAVAVAMATTRTMVKAAERARTVAMAAANAMVMAAATAVNAAMLMATAMAALKWLSSSSEAAVGLSVITAVVRQCRLMLVVAMMSLPWQ
jgi:hypothetical protein